MIKFLHKKRDLRIDENTFYASFMWRIAASIIDTILSILLLVPIFHFIRKSMNVLTLEEAIKLDKQQLIPELMKILQASSIEISISTLVVIVFWFYRCATPGKIILKMKIVDSKTFEDPSKFQMIIRYLGYFVSLIPFGLGFLWINYSKKQQGFHDMMSKTVVIREIINKS